MKIGSFNRDNFKTVLAIFTAILKIWHKHYHPCYYLKPSLYIPWLLRTWIIWLYTVSCFFYSQQYGLLYDQSFLLLQVNYWLISSALAFSIRVKLSKSSFLIPCLKTQLFANSHFWSSIEITKTTANKQLSF